MNFDFIFENTELIENCKNGDIDAKHKFAELVSEYTFTSPFRIKFKIPVFTI